MAEAIAVISFVSAVSGLVSFGWDVSKRLNEFRKNVRELPEAFKHIDIRLPFLLETLDRLKTQAKPGDIVFLDPVVVGLQGQLQRLREVLDKVLPSAKASTWEKGLKAVKSLHYEKVVEEFDAVIERYISDLTLFQTTSNGRFLEELQHLVEKTSQLQLAATTQPLPPAKSPKAKAIFEIPFDPDTDFIAREEVIRTIEERFKTSNRVALAGIGGVG